jgi:cytochrome bd-type quinol oxidase subunit 2
LKLFFLKLSNLNNKHNFSEIITIFKAPNTIFLISLILIFILIPIILFLLEKLSKKEEKRLYKNHWIVLFYIIVTLGIYQLYWFWFIKKELKEDNINTISLWWFLFPFLGTILIYIDFSKALEKKTKIKFIKWFLIFIFFQGLNVVINQTIINKE